MVLNQILLKKIKQEVGTKIINYFNQKYYQKNLIHSSII